MYVICRTTCIAKPNKACTKPKYNKYKDTFVNAFNDINLAKKYLKEWIIKQNMDIVDMYPERKDSLIRKYGEKFLNRAALFVLVNMYGKITTYNIYYIYCTDDSTLAEEPTYMNPKYDNFKEDLVSYYEEMKYNAETKENGSD